MREMPESGGSGSDGGGSGGDGGRAQGGGGGGDGGGIASIGSLVLRNSTITNNVSGSGGSAGDGGAGGDGGNGQDGDGGSGGDGGDSELGGRGGDGGGIITFGILTVENSTIVNNRTGFAGPGGRGGVEGRGGEPGGPASNEGDFGDEGEPGDFGFEATGGGIRSGNSTLTLRNSIIAENSAIQEGNDIRTGGSLIVNEGNNIIGDNDSVSSAFPTGSPNTNGDYVGAGRSPFDPRLAPIGNYGGPTQTTPPLPGSAATEGGELLATTPTLDQIGSARPSGPLPDIGSVEAVALTSLSPLVDTDSDGIDDRIETSIFGNLTSADDTSDRDGDGSSDIDEIANMTDPLDNTDLFQVLGLDLSPDFATTGNATLSLTTFPGLRYAIETSSSLTDFTALPGNTFTATDFNTRLTLELETPRDFIRAARLDQ